MKYVPPVGQPADTPYENFDPQNGVDGSVVSAEAVEHPMREIVNALIALGVTPDAAKLDQLATALTGKLKAGGHNHNIADVNTLQTTLDGKAASNHTHAAGDITGAASSTRKINTTAPLAGGGDLSADRTFKLDLGKGLKVDTSLLTLALVTGSALVFKYNDSTKLYELDIDFSQMPTDKFEAMVKSIRVPIWLTKNTIWYVNSETGSDANDGSSATKAFKTVQYAVNYVAENYNIGSYTGTINIAGGSYSGNIQLPKFSASTGTLQFVGSTDAGNPTVILGSISPAGNGVGTYALRNLTLRYAGEVSPGSSFYSAIRASQGTSLRLFNVTIDLTTTGTYSRVALNSNGGEIMVYDNCAFSGSALHFFYTIGGKIELHRDMSVNGGVSGATLQGTNVGAFNTNSASNGGVNPVISGTVTGKRYYLVDNSICNIAGGGPSYFPGSIDGTYNYGGQYR